MSKPGTNPVEYTYAHPTSSSGPKASNPQSIPHPGPISCTTHHIAGILTTVYGVSELSPSTSEVAVLWLLHPRLQTQACMEPFASHLISSWNNSGSKTSKKGLIAVSFDQRNHGSREVSAIANEAWRSGNEHHAQDMFSCYHGTACDTSLLLDYLAAYVFPDDRVKITQNIVLGISLGGHAAWHVVMQDPRFSAAIVTIGCPDYTRLMSDRARLSKRKSHTETKPAGAGFIGSRDFPHGLVAAIKKYDPAGLIWGSALHERRRGQEHLYDSLTDDERARVMPVMVGCFGNKRILNLSGGADKLVPYHCGEPFMKWLQNAMAKGGWFEGSGFYLEDIILPGVGHAVPGTMVPHMLRFVHETLDGEAEIVVGKRGSRDSRI